MQKPWEVRAVWVDRDGRHTIRLWHFDRYDDARREVVRLFPHLGVIGCDERALEGLNITGDYWLPDERQTAIA